MWSSTLSLAVFAYLFYFKIIESNAARILGISWYPAISHQSFFQPIFKALALRGHEVTILTPVPMNDKSLKNLTEIDISFLFDVRRKTFSAKIFTNTFQSVTKGKYYASDLFEAALASNEVQGIIKSEEKFDVIIAEPHCILVYAFGERFKAPVVGLSSLTVANEVYDLYANPTHPLISPDFTMIIRTSPNNHPFSVRFESFLHNIWERMFFYWFLLPHSDKIVKKYFDTNFPYLWDICLNYSSILLTNVNILTNPVRANVPSVIEINQIHIRENRSLPKDLQSYLDSSFNGAVYFSLGTHILSNDLSRTTWNEIIRSFSELPFNVILKWDGEKLPNLPPNVMARNFFPQQDLLAHPNVKVFVTQGGIQSIEEAISKEVPMVGIPFIADQPLNVKSLVDVGLAVGLQPSDITKDSLKNAIMEVAENKRFREAVKKYKLIMEDQPLKGVDKAVWWIEYVIRHKGAKHLRSPAIDMSYCKYFMIDVIALLFTIILCIYYSLLKLVNVLRSKTKFKSKKE